MPKNQFYFQMCTLLVDINSPKIASIIFCLFGFAQNTYLNLLNAVVRWS